jgi:hypothetical protein
MEDEEAKMRGKRESSFGMGLIPKAVNQIPTTGQAAKKKCRELLKRAYWKIYRPK